MADTKDTKTKPEEDKSTCGCGCGTEKKAPPDQNAKDLEEIKEATIAAVIEGTVEGE